jgi:hypothetical protein
VGWRLVQVGAGLEKASDISAPAWDRPIRFQRATADSTFSGRCRRPLRWLASKEAKMLVGTLRRGSGMTGSGGVAVPVVGSERFCRSDALNCVLSRLLGAGFGTGTACAVESVAAPATETATIKANAARVPASVIGSAGRNFVILVNARSWFASRRNRASVDDAYRRSDGK